MRSTPTILAFVATIVITGTVVMANPALMQKNKPGYPYPGTAAVEHFGSVALQEAVLAENAQNRLGIVTDQRGGMGGFEGKSLLPPKDDPAKISPRPELKDFPLYKGFGPVVRD